jgi:hypothetical protein
MCICSAPAHLSNTLIYVGEAARGNQSVHVLAYQNTADNESSGPNAMILPFPAAEAMGPENILDTRPYKSFLKDITNATKQQTRSLDMLNSKGASPAGAQVFDVGSYTVVLAEKASHIHGALELVPENKRPTISTRFLVGFGKLYPNQPIAVCCWDGNIKAEPLLWWYVPTNKDTLFIPTMDAHDGNAPDVNARVATDHIISVGSTSPTRVGHHFRVDYNDFLPMEAAQLLPAYVYGTKVNGLIKNGDMFVNANGLGKNKEFREIPNLYRESLSSQSHWEMMGWS